MPTNEEITAYVNARWGEVHAAKAKAALGTLLLLAQKARAEYPTATVIKLDASDQGEFMNYAGVLDANGDDLDTDHELDEEGLCWVFDEGNADTWQPFCIETANSRRHNPEYVIQIDQVLTGITLLEPPTSIEDVEKFLAEPAPPVLADEEPVGKYDRLWVMQNKAGLRWSVADGEWVTVESNRFTSWRDTTGFDWDDLNALATKHNMPAGEWVNINEA